MNKQKQESFYEKHYYLFWCIAGYIGTLTIALVRGASFSKDTDYLFFLALLIASPALGIFWYSLFMFTTLVLSLLWDGIKEQDPASLFGAFWLGIGLLSLITSTLF